MSGAKDPRAYTDASLYAGDAEGAKALGARLAVTLTFRGVAFHIPEASVTPATCRFAFSRPESSAPGLRTILCPMDGVIAPGSLVAIMGPSGCGKSTLLDILAGRKPKTEHEGDVRVNGHPAWGGAGGGDGRLPRLSAYVPQSDTCSPHVTVEEAVRFACELKGDYGYLTSVNRAGEREHHVRVALELCGLAGVAGTRVGDDSGRAGSRGVSGGQRRRLSIARALVGGPSLCFLDEPTSGLSATDAERVVSLFGRLAKTFKTTFVAVVHAPRAAVFALFSDLILLTPGGKCVYNGPGAGAHAPERASTSVCMPEAVSAYVAERGFPAAEGVPIAEWLLDLVTPAERENDHRHGANHDAVDGNERPADVLWRAYETTVAPVIRRRVNDLNARPGMSPRDILSRRHNPLASRPERQHVVGFWRQLAVLGARDVRVVYRDHELLRVILGNALAMGLLVGLVFLDVRGKAPEYQLSFVFMVVVISSLSANNSVPVYVSEHAVFLREREEGMYGALPYALSKTGAWIAVNGGANVIFAVLTYFMAGFSGAVAFGRFLGVVLLAFFATDGLTALLATCATSHQMANAMTGAAIGVLSLFNGFTANRLNMPSWLYWIQYLSPFYWGFVAAAIPLMRTYGVGSVDSAVGSSRAYGVLAENYDWHSWMSWAGPLVLAAMWIAFRTATAAVMASMRSSH